MAEGGGDIVGRECDRRLVYGGAPEQAGNSNVAILRNRLLDALNKARAVRRVFPHAITPKRRLLCELARERRGERVFTMTDCGEDRSPRGRLRGGGASVS